MASIALIILL
jgi:hypothetical protein